MIDTARLHRETYIAVIHSLLRKRGDKQSFAKRAGIRSEHFSNLLNPGLTADAYRRTASRPLAERLVELLPVNPEVGASLREHFYLAWAGERGKSGYYRPQRMLSYYAILDILDDLWRAHLEASYTPHAHLARQSYNIVRHVCQLILPRIDPDPDRVGCSEPELNANPLEFVQVCLFLSNVQCIRNRADDALFHARLASQIMEVCDRERFRDRRDYFDHLGVNILVAESHAYRALKLPKQAEAATQSAEALVCSLGSASERFWLPHIYMHRLKAIIQKSRFTLAEVDGLLLQIDNACGGQVEDLQPHWDLQVEEARARGYLQYGIRCGTGHSIKVAARTLRQSVERMENGRATSAPAVIKAQVAATYASILWHQDDREGWDRFIRRSVAIAHEAGLDHQLAEARQAYGPALVAILQEVETAPQTAYGTGK